MGTYDNARRKTRAAIIHAFWSLYMQKTIARSTVKNSTGATGIHRATCYLYCDSVYDYGAFLTAMRKLYDENETFLEPLLCQYRGQEFASQYRQIMKDKLRKDIGWRQYPETSKEYLLTDSVLSGMIETFISCLRTRVIPLDCAYRIASKSVENGIASAMKQELGIAILPQQDFKLRQSVVF